MKYKQKIYDVEKIITRRIIGKKRFYLIKWEGYPISDCSWEPISHLYNIIDMVTKFDENFPFSIEQESLNQFYAEMKKTKNKKFKKKVKKKCSNKKIKVNKIIIPIDDIDLDIDIDNSIKNEEKQDEEKSNIEANVISDNKDKNINENEINKINEINDINGNRFTKDITNENSEQKLIWPIIIW